MQITLSEKISYFKNYIKDLLNSKFFSYGEIIEHGKKNNNLKRTLNLFQIYQMFFYDNYNFNEKKLVIKYNGPKKFIVGIKAISHHQITKHINNICSKNDYETKMKQQFPDFIKDVFFMIHDENPISILNILNECIEYDNTKITFNDIAEICLAKNIISIKIIYVQKFKKKEKIIDYKEYKNDDVGILNNVFD